MPDYEKQAEDWWVARNSIADHPELIPLELTGDDIASLATLLESVARDARAEEREMCAAIALKLKYYGKPDGLPDDDPHSDDATDTERYCMDERSEEIAKRIRQAAIREAGSEKGTENGD